jgi:Holliday junction resolvase RusA-like endonuclease
MRKNKYVFVLDDITPAPKGSFNTTLISTPGGKRIALYPQNSAELMKYTKALKEKFREVMSKYNLKIIENTVHVICKFRFEIKKYKQREINKRENKYHDTTPDLDKLLRAVLDALTNEVIVDDRKVSMITAEKKYADKSGVYIEIIPL